MTVCKEALDLITEFEGYLKRLKDGTDRVVPYRCPAGVATIGYGSIWRADGSRVEMTDPPITRAQALHLFDLELTAKCIPAVSRLITVKLHPLMHGALVSFAYNLGEGALRASTLRRKINERRWGEVPAEFAKYRVAKGVVLAGLVRRRKAESDMFMYGVKAQATPAAPLPVEPPPIDNTRWVTTVLRAAEAAERNGGAP